MGKGINNKLVGASRNFEINATISNKPYKKMNEAVLVKL